MTEDWTELFGDDVPYHLRLDTAPLGQCNRCGSGVVGGVGGWHGGPDDAARRKPLRRPDRPMTRIEWIEGMKP